MKNDSKIARIGRNLAEALAAVAYDRRDEDKKRVSVLQSELCQAVREEVADSTNEEKPYG